MIKTKEQLIEEMRAISQKGWFKSVKRIKDTRNDGAVGNTLEKLLGIPENNLPIANTNGWELKGQRLRTTSLVTLKHYDPFPRSEFFLPRILLPLYGWSHKLAGKKYPKDETSFRSTTGAMHFTNRGFKVVIDRQQKKIRFVFDSSKADSDDPEIAKWLLSVKTRVGLGPLNPEPYWGFDDLQALMGAKVRNCFYVIADSKVEKGIEYFHYLHLLILSGYTFEKFLSCIERDIIKVDFDARTHHNHGTKFRIKQDEWKELYAEVKQEF